MNWNQAAVADQGDEIVKRAYSYWQAAERQEERRVVFLLASAEDNLCQITQELNYELLRMDNSFNHPGSIDFDGQPEIIKIMASVNAVVELYLMRRYDYAFPGASADLLNLANKCLTESQYSEYVEYASLLLRRHIVFERMKILRQVMDPVRCEAVLSFINNYR